MNKFTICTDILSTKLSSSVLCFIIIITEECEDLKFFVHHIFGAILRKLVGI